MHRQEKFDLYLDGRLRIWARWKAGEHGWPPVTLLSIMLEYGNLSHSFSGSKPPVGITHTWAEEVNTWVNRMHLQKPLYADAIKAYYCELKKGVRMRDIARARNISVTVLKDRIRGARDWLSGRLDASINDKEFNEPKKSA